MSFTLQSFFELEDCATEAKGAFQGNLKCFVKLSTIFNADDYLLPLKRGTWFTYQQTRADTAPCEMEDDSSTQKP